VAMDALEQGLETPSMIELASCYRIANPDHHRLFEKALAELARSPLSKAEAGRTIARHYASQICSGELPPLEGAKAIWKITLECEALVGEFGIFGGLATQDDGGSPTLRDHINDMIVSEAKELISRT